MNVYFPGNQIWYDIVSFQKYEVSGEISIQVIYVLRNDDVRDDCLNLNQSLFLNSWSFFSGIYFSELQNDFWLFGGKKGKLDIKRQLLLWSNLVLKFLNLIEKIQK